MSTLVASLKRLYAAGRYTIEQAKASVEKGTITADEYKEITGKKYA